jgi:flagellar basal body-associated protein FliL
MSDENPETEAKPEKPKGGGGGGGLGKIAALFGLLNLGATGFLVFHTLTHPPGAAAAHAPVEHVAPAPLVGPIASLDPFVVNLRDEGQSRYLKTTFELELDNDKTLAQLTDSKRAIRDDILRFLSSLTVVETLGEDGKQRIQDGILARLDKQLGQSRVKKFYFIDFVIQ